MSEIIKNKSFFEQDLAGNFGFFPVEESHQNSSVSSQGVIDVPYERCGIAVEPIVIGVPAGI